MNARRIGSMCTGYGGLDMAVQQVFGGDLAWVADPDPGAAVILAHHHPDVPNLGDIKEVDWESISAVDIVCAGFPCTDISHAGLGAGIVKGNRSGVWYTIADAVGVLRPRLLVLENVAAIVGRRPGLDVVLADLARLGFDAEWTCVRASDTVDAAHGRPRWFLAAYPANFGHEWTRFARGRRPGPPDSNRAPADPGYRTEPQRAWASRGTAGQRQAERGEPGSRRQASQAASEWGIFEAAIRRWEPIVGRPAPRPTEPGRAGEHLSPRFVEWLMGLDEGHVTDVPGLPRDAQLKALGNGVVPQQGTAALALLTERTAPI